MQIPHKTKYKGKCSQQFPAWEFISFIHNPLFPVARIRFHELPPLTLNLNPQPWIVMTTRDPKVTVGKEFTIMSIAVERRCAPRTSSRQRNVTNCQNITDDRWIKPTFTARSSYSNAVTTFKEFVVNDRLMYFLLKSSVETILTNLHQTKYFISNENPAYAFNQKHQNMERQHTQSWSNFTNSDNWRKFNTKFAKTLHVSEQNLKRWSTKPSILEKLQTLSYIHTSTLKT